MTDDTNKVDRRSFMGGALGAAAGVGVAALLQESAKAQPPAGLPGITNSELRPSMRMPGSLFRLEADVRDCEIEGTIPSDLNGAFYRVGPDA